MLGASVHTSQRFLVIDPVVANVADAVATGAGFVGVVGGAAGLVVGELIPV